MEGIVWIVTDSEMYHKHKIHVSTLMNGFILEGKAASLVVKEALRASHHLALIVIQGIRSSTTMSPITVELCDGAQAINCSWVYSRCSPLPSCLPPPLFFMYASVFHDYVFPVSMSFPVWWSLPFLERGWSMTVSFELLIGCGDCAIV